MVALFFDEVSLFSRPMQNRSYIFFALGETVPFPQKRCVDTFFSGAVSASLWPRQSRKCTPPKQQ